MTGCKDDKEVDEKIKNIPRADVYGFTTYCTNYNNIKRGINYIKEKYPDSFIVLGGPNATALPEYTLEDSGCDVIIVGEGEDAFLEFIQKIEFYKIMIPCIIYGQGREDIDSYPMPAYDLINFDDYTRVLDGERVVSIISSRGCDRNCTHCNSVIMGGGSRGKKKVRYRSIENVISEIKYLKGLGFKHFRFNDDIFTSNPNLEEFLIELGKLDIKYRIFARVEDLTLDTCYLLSKSGCIAVAVGIESMNPDNLRFLRKQSQSGKEKNLWNAKKYNLLIRCYFIVGLPFDTDNTIKQYFEDASKLPFQEWTCYPLIPYCGTEIWKTPKKYGYKIIDKDFTKYIQIGKNKATCYVLDHKLFNHKDVKRWVNYVNNLFENRGKIHTGDSKVMK